MDDDEALLRQYASERSEAAFREVVSRHIDLVYSAALRVVGGDRHLAQDVTQIVFTDLARKASGLPRGVVLAGWLHRHTSFTAAKAVRTERRRQSREHTAMEMRALDEPAGPDWEAVAPHLDEGLTRLSAADRDAIVLRFLKAQDFRAVGAALGVSEDAAQKRVTRALERLRSVLGQRGIALTAAAMTSLLGTQAVTAAPAGLAASVTAASVAAGANVGTGVSLTMLKVVAMTKVQAGLTGALVVAALATPLVMQRRSLHRAQEETRLLREENQGLRAQADQLAALTEENHRLSNLVAQASRPQPRPQGQSAEVLQLRELVTRLQSDSRTDGKPPGSLAGVLESSDLKEATKPILGTIVAKSYARLFADLRLTPEQSAAVTDLVLEKQLAGIDASAAKRKGQTQEVKAKQDELNDRIRQLLGNENYAHFQDYEKTAPQRAGLRMFEDQLAGESALTPDQEEQLIKAMTEEKRSAKVSADDSAADSSGQQLQQQEELNQRYLARAQQILSPDQIAAFAKFLANQQQMMAAMMQVRAKMSAPQ